MRSTNRMPVSAARSSRRGLPPFGLGGSGGIRGSMIAHRASETRGAAIPLPTAPRRFCYALLIAALGLAETGRDGLVLVRLGQQPQRHQSFAELVERQQDHEQARLHASPTCQRSLRYPCGRRWRRVPPHWPPGWRLSRPSSPRVCTLGNVGLCRGTDLPKVGKSLILLNAYGQTSCCASRQMSTTVGRLLTFSLLCGIFGFPVYR